MINFLKKPITIVALVLLAGVIGYVFFVGDDASPYQFTVVERRGLLQEVNVIGSVRPAESVDLAFEKSGKVSRVYVEVGDKIRAWQTLVVLENSELAAQLLQAEANLELEQVKLSELEKGIREEEIQIAETKVVNMTISLEDTEKNLQNVANKADADISEDYNASLITAQTSFSIADNALIIASSLQRSYFGTTTQEGSKIIIAVNLATDKLENNAKPAAQDAVSDFTQENIDIALTITLDALNKTKEALDVIPTPTRMTSADKIILKAEKVSIDAQISLLSGKIQAIFVQKATNASNISTAEAGVRTARNSLLSAENELSLKKAGATPEQIASQKAKVKSAQASVQNVKAQSAKTILRSPIGGVISTQDVQVGEIVSANIVIVSIISEAKFKIEANVPEVDIAKIEIGDKAPLTLDAYGSDIIFLAHVVTIDLAETIIDGVTTYKITLEFERGDDRIRSGMSANLDILTDERQDIITVPQRSVITRNGGKFVRVIRNGLIDEVEVKTGLIGTEGLIEITEGLNEGDKVVTFVGE